MERPRWFVDFEASGIAPNSYPLKMAFGSARFTKQLASRPHSSCFHWKASLAGLALMKSIDYSPIGTPTELFPMPSPNDGYAEVPRLEYRSAKSDTGISLVAYFL